MFLSTVEKQVDSKRRVLLPQDFRVAATGGFDGVYCFPSFEGRCLEGGGQAFLDTYLRMIDEFPFGDPVRTAIETSVLGKMVRLSFDTAGRITLPEPLSVKLGLTDWVAIVGLGVRFQIWSREAFEARESEQMDVAREGLHAVRAMQRGAPRP